VLRTFTFTCGNTLSPLLYVEVALEEAAASGKRGPSVGPEGNVESLRSVDLVSKMNFGLGSCRVTRQCFRRLPRALSRGPHGGLDVSLEQIEIVIGKPPSAKCNSVKNNK